MQTTNMIQTANISEKAEDKAFWTPERLKRAKPIEMPHAPSVPTSKEEPNTPQTARSQSGVGNAGSGEVAPEEDNPLIP